MADVQLITFPTFHLDVCYIKICEAETRLESKQQKSRTFEMIQFKICFIIQMFSGPVLLQSSRNVIYIFANKVQR